MATLVRLDRDRAFYPTVLVVIASYYALFAVMGGSSHALLLEGTAIIVFLAAAVVGFKRSLWLVVAALAAHGIFDGFHGRMIANPGVPLWWAQFLPHLRCRGGWIPLVFATTPGNPSACGQG
jgi:hypothetical protein